MWSWEISGESCHDFRWSEGWGQGCLGKGGFIGEKIVAYPCIVFFSAGRRTSLASLVAGEKSAAQPDYNLRAGDVGMRISRGSSASKEMI